MVDEEVVKLALEFLLGLIALLILVGFILGFYSQIKKIKKESQEKLDKAVLTAKIESEQETKSTIAFNELKKVVERMDGRLETIDNKLDDKVSKIENVLSEYKAELAEVKAIARRANKRIDIHKRYDHGFENIEYLDEESESKDH